MVGEEFVAKHGILNKKDGTRLRFLYIDPATSENTYQYKDIIRNKYGASWIKSVGKNGAWGWWLDGTHDEEVWRNKVQPCLIFLDSVAKNNGNKGQEAIIKLVDDLIRQASSSEIASTADNFNAQDFRNKLENFKRELVTRVSDEEFKALLGPILKFKSAMGHQFSFTNTLLIYLQDPKAKMVKARSRWAAMNRKVKPGAPAIALITPNGGKKGLSKEEKEKIKQEFIEKCGKHSYEELTPGEKERLDVIINGNKATSFDIIPCFYDYRYTEQMEGKEDLVGDPDADVPWFEETGEETDDSVLYVEAMKNLITHSGISLGYVDDMGGARGVSKSGSIDVLSSAKRDWGLLNTLVHEFSHELLHQRYLKNNNSDLGEYFVGTEEGRAKVEQQAELSAWIVLKSLGKDMPTNINYVGIWGLDENNATKVFDTVSRVAEYIFNNLRKEYDNLKGSKTQVAESVSESCIPSGREIAYLVGCGEIYDKAANRERSEIGMINEQFYSILNKIQ